MTGAARPTARRAGGARGRATKRTAGGGTTGRTEAAGKTARRTGSDADSPRPLTQPLVVTTAVAVILAALYLAAPRMGGDLSAQLAHADFARDHPLLPIDFRWFGGTLPFGYSLTVPWLGAVIGTRLLGALAAVAGSMLTATIFVRTGVRRPVVGGALAAVCQVANLTEGRIAFAVGLVFALLAVLVLTDARGEHRFGLVVAAFLAATASPVAGLLVGAVALTVLIHRRVGDAVRMVIGAGAGVAVVSVLFADGGAAIYNGVDAARAAAVTLLVGVLAPRRLPLLRTGAAVGVIMVAAAYFLDTSVGGNASRLALLFAVPVVGAVVEWPAWKAAVAVVLAAVVQTPVTFGTLADAGGPPTRVGYFMPLTDHILAAGALTGRVEIPELTGHWEATYAARAVPLARGWLRQADTELNADVFYDHAPTATTYRSFLQRSAVQYVAVPDARLTFYGRREADLVDKGLPYLTKVWTNPNWTLYAVTDATPVIGAPATDPSLGAATIGFAAPANSQVPVGVRWFDWLSLESSDPGACIAQDGDDAVVRTKAGGSYTVTSTLTGNRRHC